MTAVPSYQASRERRLRRETEQKAKVTHVRNELELEIVSDPAEAEYRIKDSVLASNIGKELVANYPGHGWQVECDIRNGVAKLFNVHMSGTIGWMLKLADLRESSYRQDIKRIGGEMLERSGLSRGPFNELEVMAKQRDTSGQARIDLS